MVGSESHGHRQTLVQALGGGSELDKMAGEDQDGNKNKRVSQRFQKRGAREKNFCCVYLGTLIYHTEYTGQPFDLTRTERKKSAHLARIGRLKLGGLPLAPLRLLESLLQSFHCPLGHAQICLLVDPPVQYQRKQNGRTNTGKIRASELEITLNAADESSDKNRATQSTAHAEITPHFVVPHTHVQPYVVDSFAEFGQLEVELLLALAGDPFFTLGESLLHRYLSTSIDGDEGTAQGLNTHTRSILIHSNRRRQQESCSFQRKAKNNTYTTPITCNRARSLLAACRDASALCRSWSAALARSSAALTLASRSASGTPPPSLLVHAPRFLQGGRRLPCCSRHCSHTASSARSPVRRLRPWRFRGGSSPALPRLLRASPLAWTHQPRQSLIFARLMMRSKPVLRLSTPSRMHPQLRMFMDYL